MNEHLLMLDALHAAAPGVLDVVFGPDGKTRWDRVSRWTGHVVDVRSGDSGPISFWPDNTDALLACRSSALCGSLSIHDGGDLMPIPHECAALDLLTPSTACRIAGLCLRAGADHNGLTSDLCWEIIAEAMDHRIHPETAARMVALTLRLAPKIAALKVHH